MYISNTTRQALRYAENDCNKGNLTLTRYEWLQTRHGDERNACASIVGDNTEGSVFYNLKNTTVNFLEV
jgi:hypothetical protein